MINTKNIKENKFSFLKEALFFLVLYSFACLSWYFIYVQEFLEFWFTLAASSWVLGTLSMQRTGFPIKNEDISFKALGLGIVLAVLLYFIFFLGFKVFSLLEPLLISWNLPLVSNFQEDLNYLSSLKHEVSLLFVCLVIIFITSPYEEFFWRAYVQGIIEQKTSPFMGILFSSLLYMGVQLSTGSLPLILASFIAGIYFASIYYYTKNLLICIITHIIWALAVFIIFPFA